MNEPALYNFAAATGSERWVYGGARPGHSAPPELGSPRTPRGPLVGAPVVTAWCQALLDKGIKRVLCLLTAHELTFYSVSLLELLRSKFRHVSHVEVGRPDCRRQLLSALEAAVAAKEPIVVMCASGQERTGNVLALWLYHRNQLAIEEAVYEVNAFAKASGAVRRASAPGVMRLLQAPGTAAVPSAPPLPPSTARRGGAAGSAAAGGPFSSVVVMAGAPVESRIAFVQMGGAIDKDCPTTSTGGYAFEIGESAVGHLLRALPTPLPFAVEFHMVCRKDSLDVTDEDRDLLMRTIAAMSCRRVIVTHGMDTLQQTARYLQRQIADVSPAAASGNVALATGDIEVIRASVANKTIILTGSMRPAKFIDSDAAFQLGAAVSVSQLLPPGVYLVVNGQVTAAGASAAVPPVIPDEPTAAGRAAGAGGAAAGAAPAPPSKST